MGINWDLRQIMGKLKYPIVPLPHFVRQGTKIGSVLYYVFIIPLECSHGHKYNTWSLSFDTWLVCVFCLHIGLATTVARPICDKNQTRHVSNDSDHVLYTYEAN